MRKPRRLPIEQLDPYQWTLPEAFRGTWGVRADNAEPPVPIDWPALFGNSHPVEIEVGFGKGLFLVESAVARPDTNFFGIEIVRKYQLYATGRIAARKLANAKTCCGDAKIVLRHFVPPESVRAVHVFFPDPWWKTHHKKRLLFTAEFAALVQRVLAPGGRLHFVTDVEDYFVMVRGLLADMAELAERPPPPVHEPRHDMDYLTNFERKFRRAGKPIHRAIYEKADS